MWKKARMGVMKYGSCNRVVVMSWSSEKYFFLCSLILGAFVFLESCAKISAVTELVCFFFLALLMMLWIWCCRENYFYMKFRLTLPGQSWFETFPWQQHLQAFFECMSLRGITRSNGGLGWGHFLEQYKLDLHFIFLFRITL